MQDWEYLDSFFFFRFFQLADEQENTWYQPWTQEQRHGEPTNTRLQKPRRRKNEHTTGTHHWNTATQEKGHVINIRTRQELASVASQVHCWRGTSALVAHHFHFETVVSMLSRGDQDGVLPQTTDRQLREDQISRRELRNHNLLYFTI